MTPATVTDTTAHQKASRYANPGFCLMRIPNTKRLTMATKVLPTQKMVERRVLILLQFFPEDENRMMRRMLANRLRASPRAERAIHAL